MMELNRILVIIEPNSEQQPALDRARQMARFADAELELLLCDYSAYLEDGYYFDPVQARTLRRRHGEEHMAELHRLAKPLQDQGLEVVVSTAWGNPPYEEILHRINETNPSCVIKSTRHHHRVSRLLLSNEDWELVRYCPVPLLLVKDRPWQEEPAIVVAVDPDHSHDKPASLDHKLLTHAADLVRMTGGDLHMFHSAHVAALAGLYPLSADYKVEQGKLNKLADIHGLNARHCHVSEKNIVHSLPGLVDDLNAAVVVMGAISRSRLDQTFIGNTAEKVLDHLSCDVLVIKPDEAYEMAKVSRHAR